MSKSITSLFYSDSAHGWLKVSIKSLFELNLQNKISGYSYMNNKYAYLEEDADATLYINEQKKKGIQIKLNQRNSFISKIRNYDRYNRRHIKNMVAIPLIETINMNFKEE